MSSQSSPDVKRPSSLACVKCRAKHLKCDAQSPVCSRCQKHGLSCSYIRSRRGLRSRRDNASQRNQTPPRRTLAATGVGGSLTETTRARQDNVFDSELLGAALPLAPADPGPAVGSSYSWDSTVTSGVHPDLSNQLAILDSNNEQNVAPLFYCGGQNCRGHSFTPPPESDNVDDIFIDLFYRYFYPAHPFVIPHRLLRQKRLTIPKHLRVAMVFAGSHFTQALPLSGTRDKAIDVLYGQGTDDGYFVQALLLLALVFHARFEEHDCLAALRKATDIALKLRMFDRDYASCNDYGIPTIAESWRRTWWELVAVDVLLPTFHPRQYESCLQQAEAGLYLPSEEQDYANCQPNPQSKTRQDFNGRLFLDENYEYSSFAYKIEAVRLLHSVRCSIVADEVPLLQSIDSSLSNFFLSLPPTKREIVSTDGSVDEVLYSAHVIANVASLLFHRCHSSFTFLGRRQPTECAAMESPKLVISTCPHHTTKALRAANNLSDAVGAHLSLKAHSPFLTCALALASSVHLPAYLMPSFAKERPTLKERLQLSISALQRIGEVWPVARVVKAQISKFAREVLFESAQSTFLPPLPAEPQYIQAQSVTSDDSWLDNLPGCLAGDTLAQDT